jgi:hypothetical protein
MCAIEEEIEIFTTTHLQRKIQGEITSLETQRAQT